MALLVGGMFVLFFVAGMFVLHIVECVWSYRDAIRRGYSQEFALLVLLGVLFFPLIGLIVYLLIRRPY